MEFKVDVTDIIQRNITEVFNAIVQPQQITKYFVSHASSELSTGEKIKWEFSDYSVELEIEVLEVEKDKLIKFSWEAPGKATVVDMNFKVVSQNATELHITESNFEMNEDSVKHALQQTQGWTDFMCSLKAYLYTGINLRNAKMNS